ncbi:hypothetical protein [Tahibacter aquaticus]|uniref:hypothetical protein n=1 Tax=Tahibacter aquaticus TaxID=520092 RepID=UPI00105DD8BF|nr:hypothetical protein [Tahibacter aquaticus]
MTESASTMPSNSVLEDLAKHARLCLLQTNDAYKVLEKIAVLHVSDRALVYWWQGLHNVQARLSYGTASTDGLDLLSEQLEKLDSEEIYLVATDDQLAPWPVFVCCRHDVRGVLADMPFFEYFISTMDCSVLIFDTHHNELVLSIAKKFD